MILDSEKKKLIPWNERETKTNVPPLRYKLNGYACPKCGSELYEDNLEVLASHLPQTPVLCLTNKCDFRSSRSA